MPGDEIDLKAGAHAACAAIDAAQRSGTGAGTGAFVVWVEPEEYTRAGSRCAARLRDEQERLSNDQLESYTQENAQ